MINTSEFSTILTGLFSGNRGEAQQAAEIIWYDNTFSLSEEYDRRRQDRLNYEAMKFSKSLDYHFTK
jgi:hypothetical protein